LGISEWANDSSGKKLSKTKVGKCKDTIRALYSPKVGGLANHISYTPWLRDNKPVLDASGNPLMLQEYFEQKWNKPKGFFTNQAVKASDNPTELTYFQSKGWKMNDGATPFSLDNMDEEMGYYVMLASSFVANSEKDWRAHKAPKALYYIAIENEGEEIKYARSFMKTKAMAILHDAAITDDTKRKLATLLGIVNSKSNLTMQQLHNVLFEAIEHSSFTPDGSISKLLALRAMLEQAVTKEQFEARFIIQQAIDRRIIYEKQGSYIWNRPNSPLTIGDRLEDAVEFILSPKKQKEVEEIIQAIKQSQ